MKFALLIAALAAPLAGSSYAADLPNPPSFTTPPIPPATEEPPSFDWDGSYFGLYAGYGISQATVVDWCGDLLSEDFPGGRVGAFVGRNWAVSPEFVVGIEGDFGYDWNSRPFNGAREVGTGSTGSARLRLGQRYGNGLFYVAGGWTSANAYMKDPDDEKFVHGWTLGAGVDLAISDVSFVRAEYRFNKFGGINLRGTEARFDQSTVNIGLGVSF